MGNSARKRIFIFCVSLLLWTVIAGVLYYYESQPNKALRNPQDVLRYSAIIGFIDYSYVSDTGLVTNEARNLVLLLTLYRNVFYVVSAVLIAPGVSNFITKISRVIEIREHKTIITTGSIFGLILVFALSIWTIFTMFSGPRQLTPVVITTAVTTVTTVTNLAQTFTLVSEGREPAFIFGLGTILIPSASALIGIYLGAKLTERSSARAEKRKEFLHSVSLLQRFVEESVQTLSEFVTRYDDFDQSRKEGKGDIVRAAELGFRAKPMIERFSYLDCYDALKKSLGLDFVPSDVSAPLTSDDELNTVLQRFYSELVELKKYATSNFQGQIPAIRTCHQRLRDEKAKLDTIVRKRYGSVH